MKTTGLLIGSIFAISTLTAYSQTQYTPISATIPMHGTGTFGGTLNMAAEVFKPSGDVPIPVMIYAHGRASTQQERSGLREVIPRQYLDFWLKRGFAAVGVARPGYGLTGGSDREIPGHTWDTSGRCSGNFNPERVAENGATAIRATIEWVKQQPWAKQGAIVVTGNSVGGMTSVALGAKQPEGVAAIINFSGGTGGNPSLAPARSCMPERITDLFRKLGSTSRTSNLWLYAENDLFWGAESPKTWHAAYVSGGAPLCHDSCPVS